MDRHIYAAIALGLIGWLGGNALGAPGISTAEVQERVKAHINDRMYECCRSVTLTENPDGTYEGFALLINGVRSGLHVRVSGQDISYAFTNAKSPVESAAPSPSDMPASGATAADATASQEAEAPQTPTAVDLTFTSSTYTQIQKGMTYRQVADVLGADGEQQSSSYFDGAANQVYVWINADESHICVVFRDGAVLVKTQSGLPGIAPLPPFQAVKSELHEFERFHNWQLARELDGRISLLGLSLSQWLEKVNSVRSVEPAQVEIAEQEDGLAVNMVRKDPQGVAHHITFFLTCLSPGDEGIEGATGAEIDVLCIPSHMTNDDKETNSPDLTWKAMAELSGLNTADQRSSESRQ